MKARMWTMDDNAVALRWLREYGPELLKDLGLIDTTTESQMELILTSKIYSERCLIVAVTTDEEEVIGLGMADHLQPDGSCVGMIVIDPKQRGKGYWIEKKALQFVANLGVKIVTALVEPHNDLAINLHKKLGFKIPDVITMVLRTEEVRV